MTDYNCKRCGYKSDIKNSLKKHLERKNICKPKLTDIPVNILISELNEQKTSTPVPTPQIQTPQVQTPATTQTRNPITVNITGPQGLLLLVLQKKEMKLQWLLVN